VGESRVGDRHQYIKEGAVFAPNVKEGGFFAEMLKNQPRGTSDTSRIATITINNPNAINPIFELGARLTMAEEEKIRGNAVDPGEQASMKVPHISKDGADSVGVPGATIRVYVNIGLFSQHWLAQHKRADRIDPPKAIQHQDGPGELGVLAGDAGEGGERGGVFQTAEIRSGSKTRRWKGSDHQG